MTDDRIAIQTLFQETDFPDNTAFAAKNLVGNRKVLIYGGGGIGITFLFSVADRFGCDVYAVLDRKFNRGDSFYGLPASSPEEYNPSAEEKKNVVVVIAVSDEENYVEMHEVAVRLGFHNIVWAIDIYELQLFHSPPELALQGYDYFLQREDQIKRTWGIFLDELSRIIYVRFLQTHMMRRRIPIPDDPLDRQYFPENIKLGKGYQRFICCGAFNGDTVRHLHAKHGRIGSLACFEPDKQNFNELSSYLSSHHAELADHIVAFPCGTYSRSDQLRFSGSKRTSSTISESGDTFIQCVSIDDALPGFSPTFIHMDVEGAELSSLQGAERTIRECRPDLAICVYHYPNHLWEIPQYVADLDLDYKLYLRNYTSFTIETVLYATINDENMQIR